MKRRKRILPLFLAFALIFSICVDACTVKASATQGSGDPTQQSSSQQQTDTTPSVDSQTSAASDTQNTTNTKTATVKNGWQKVKSTWVYYKNSKALFKSNPMHTAWNKIKKKTSKTKYFIVVSLSACRTFVFKKSGKSWIPYKLFVCSPGKSSTPTVKGTFTVKNKGYSFGGSSYTCYYYTQFYGGYLFHSVLYRHNSFKIKDGRLGKHLSHGCVRLSLKNAKWINKTIPRGTKVYIY